MRFWGKRKEKEPAPGKQPHEDSGWDSFLLAAASGAGIIAITVMEIEFFPALILGEVTASALTEAQRRHDRKMELQHDWHMSLLGQRVDHLLERLMEKPLHGLTDKDRIHLALLSDWGFIAPDMEAKMPGALKAEILMTQLTISAHQQGISIMKLEEKFAFPKLPPDQRATVAGIAALKADRQRMKDMLLEAERRKNAPSLAARLSSKLGQGLLGKAAHIVAKDVKAVGRGVGLAFELPSLRRIWGIMTAKGPAKSAEEFMERMAKDLSSTYEGGIVRIRCATRRHFKKAGIPHESVLVPKPEGGKRFIVRRKPN